MDSSGFDGTDIYVDPAAFCGVAARMLAEGGRDALAPVLALLGQALCANVDLLEAGTTRAAIPRPRLRGAAPDSVDLSCAAPIDLPIRARGAVLAVLSIEPNTAGIPAPWTKSPGPLGTIADLVALTLSSGSEPDAVNDVRSAARSWFDLDEQDRKQLAGELHDGLVQSLVAARYLLDLAASTWPDGPLPWLEAVRESIQAALTDGRGLLNSVQPRVRAGRGLRVALEDLCAGAPVPVELHPATPAEDAPSCSEPAPVAAAAGYRFVQAAFSDLIARGAEAIEVRLSTGPSGLSLDVSAIGDRPAWPDEPGDGIRRWVTRVELMGGTVLLQSASAHLRFGAADGEHASLPGDVHAGRAK
ncbi:MAG TPA: histidine kinase [Frankiaceae bacterium]|nr:histidine kinase [Frankiaceae bacterium]